MNKNLKNFLGTTALLGAMAFSNKTQAQQSTIDNKVDPYEITVDSTDYHNKLQMGGFDYIIPFNDALRVSNLETENQSAADFAGKLVNGARRRGAQPTDNKVLYIGLKKNSDNTFTASYLTGSTYSENLGSVEEMRYNKNVDWSVLAAAAKLLRYNYDDCTSCTPYQSQEQNSRYLENLGKSITVTGDYYWSPNEDQDAAEAFNFNDRFRFSGRLGIFDRISAEVGLYFGFKKDGSLNQETILMEEELRSGRLARLVEVLNTHYSSNKTTSVGLNGLLWTDGNKSFSLGGGVSFGNVTFNQTADQKELYYFNGELEGQGTLPVESTTLEDVDKKLISPYGYIEGKIGRFNVGAGVEYTPNGTVEFENGTPRLVDDLSLFGRVGINLGNYNKR